MKIPFNIPVTCIESAENVRHLIDTPGAISEKRYTQSCREWFKSAYPDYHACLVTSCTKAMELIALSIDIQDGDEVIIPSYCYVGVANSFVNLGAKLILIDIDPETMNIDAAQIEHSITPRTRAVIVMHYGGVVCDMAPIVEVCQRKGILLIEDNAHGILARYEDRSAGSFGDFSCISFDSLKNISCGEGGVLLYKEKYKTQVENCFENGTNKNDFIDGKADFYEWVSKGSKFALSEFSAAVLYPLLERSKYIITERKKVWRKLYDAIALQPDLAGLLTPRLLDYDHNGHIFFLKCRDTDERNNLMRYMNSRGVECSFHYIPVHSSRRGRELGLDMERDKHTTIESDRLLRLPVYNELSDQAIDSIVNELKAYYQSKVSD